ncbi:hypothetical protein Ahy_B01g052098 [Arachis hypogaea]|uniref:CCHC-type domain-containing protein n=1 Tax=Arachis hypogaea TaxID=3818 RepID=A0A445ANJ9_ARAHY|nr:hypothetical protein Ahy_B01g052098 [Arachis hypogaea]
MAPMGLITIVCHHGESFVRSEEGVVSYTRDHISEIPKVDPDRLDVFFIRNYYKELGYDKAEHCWWLIPKRPLETGLRKLNSDAELLEMCFLAESNHGEVHVYYEHGVSIPTYLEEPPFRKDKEEVVVEVPTQPVLLRTEPSSKTIPPDIVPTPCINRPSTTKPTKEATSTKTTPAPPMDHTEVPAATTKSTPTLKSTIPTPISMAATPCPHPTKTWVILKNQLQPQSQHQFPKVLQHWCLSQNREILEPDDGLVPEDDSGEDDEFFSGQPGDHSPDIGGRQPEDFCHRWLTMDAYNDTYAFHINPIPGQKLWEKSLHNRPQVPKFKKMPGAPKKKRRKGVDEGPVGDKKQKITKMKMVYKEGSCRHCGGKGHDKRNCAKKADDEAVAVAAAAAAAASEANTGN